MKIISLVLILALFAQQVSASNTASRGLEADYIEGVQTSQNRLKNASFQKGTNTYVPNWTASAGTLGVNTTTANLDNLAQVGSWDASAASQTLTSNSVTITSGDGNSNQNFVASCRFKAASGTATHKIQLWDGTNVLSEQTISSSTSGYIRTSTNAPSPASGTIALRIVSAADEPVLYTSKCYLGLSEGFNVFTQGGIITDWVSYTPTLTNFGNATPLVKYRRVGDSVQVMGSITIGSTPPSGTLAVSLPGSLSGDTSKIPGGANFFTISSAKAINGGTGATDLGSVRYDSSNNRFDFWGDDGASSWNATVPKTWAVANSDVLQFDVTIPVTGWLASTVYMPDSGGLAAGDILETAATTCPTGTIAADGSSLLRADYPSLFTAIGTTYGSADSTHFTLPDARGVFRRGAGTNATTSTVGTQGTTQTDQLQGHFHSLTGTIPYSNGGATFSFNLGASSAGATPTAVGAATTDGTNGTPRTGTETRPANIVTKVCIRTVAASAAPLLVGSIKTDATASVDSEMVLWDSTSGGKVKRASGTGVAVMSSGVVTATATSAIVGLPSTSATATQERIERVRFGGTSAWTSCTGASPGGGFCTVQSMSGNFAASVGRGGTGLYVVNITSGLFSSPPTCTCVSKPVAVDDSWCQITDTPTTATAVNLQTRNQAGTLIDAYVEMICMGPR